MNILKVKKYYLQIQVKYQVFKQLKFTYSPLVKALKKTKQVKAIEDREGKLSF